MGALFTVLTPALATQIGTPGVPEAPALANPRGSFIPEYDVHGRELRSCVGYARQVRNGAKHIDDVPDRCDTNSSIRKLQTPTPTGPPTMPTELPTPSPMRDCPSKCNPLGDMTDVCTDKLNTEGDCVTLEELVQPLATQPGSLTDWGAVLGNQPKALTDQTLIDCEGCRDHTA